MTLAQKFRKSLTQRWCMRFKTKLPDGDTYDGVVTHNNRKFIVLREECDFRFDGVILLPKRIIKNCRDNKYDKCCNTIIRENGAINRLNVPRWLDSCESIVDVLIQFHRRDIWPGIEILFGDDSETAFYIGPITKVNKKSFCIRSYDAAGKWEKIYELEFGEICRIEFDSSYCNAFNEHMRAQQNP